MKKELTVSLPIGEGPEFIDCAPVGNHEGVRVGEFRHLMVEIRAFERRLAGPMPVGSNAYTETLALVRELVNKVELFEASLPLGPVVFLWKAWEKTPDGFVRVTWRCKVEGAQYGGVLGLEISEEEPGGFAGVLAGGGQ